MRNFVLSAAVVLPVACAPVPDSGSERTDDVAYTLACDEGQYSALVGLSIAVVQLPADLEQRVIGPDSAVTQDYRRDRLNLVIDEGGIIRRVYCG